MYLLHRSVRGWRSAGLLILLLHLVICNADTIGSTRAHSPEEKIRQKEVAAQSTEDVLREALTPVLSETGEALAVRKDKSQVAEVVKETETLERKPLDEPIDLEVLQQWRLDKKKSTPIGSTSDTFDKNTPNVKLGVEAVEGPDQIPNPLPIVINGQESESPEREAQASATPVENPKQTFTPPTTVNETQTDVVQMNPQPKVNEQNSIEDVKKTDRSDSETDEEKNDKTQKVMNQSEGGNGVHVISGQRGTEPITTTTTATTTSTSREGSPTAEAKEGQESSELGGTLTTESNSEAGFELPTKNTQVEQSTEMRPMMITELSTSSEDKKKEENPTQSNSPASFTLRSKLEEEPSDADSDFAQRTKEEEELVFSSPIRKALETSFFPTSTKKDAFPSFINPPLSHMELSQMYYRVMRELYGAVNLTAAVKAMREGAAHGHGRLHWLLGVLYANGVGVPQSDAKAILHHTFAAIEGIPEALMALGYRYTEGIGVEKSCERAVEYYREAADAVALTYDGFPSAVEALQDGTNTQTSASDNKKILNVLMFRADAGATDAIIALGYIYFKGRKGVARDWHRAEEFFLSALERGDTAAFGALGQLYASGDITARPPVVRDIAKAATFFAQGAAQQDPISLNGMGYLHALGYYEEDKPVEREGPLHSPDYESAARYFTESANLGSQEGMYNLGVLHLHGRGVTQNVLLAMKLFENAAARGSVLSFWQLARNEQRKGNCQRALHLYTKVTSFSSFFDRTSGAPNVLRGDVALNDAMNSSSAWHSPLPVENSLVQFLEALALAETGHGPSRWAAVQLLEDGVPIVEETPEELDGAFAASGHSPTAAVEGRGIVWLHWMHADKTRNKSSLLLAQREAMKMLRLRFYELCALSGNAEANVRLGDFYYYGESRLIGVSMTRALLYYDVAARRMNAKALFNMGFMYQMGFGMTGSPENVSLATTVYRILTNTPLRDRDRDRDREKEKEESDETAEMRLYMAKRYYDKALEVNPESAIYAINAALVSLNFQWWWWHYSSLPYGLSQWLRLPMPYPRTTNKSRPVDTTDDMWNIEQQQGQLTKVDAPDEVGWNDVFLILSGVTLFVLLLIRHHGA